MLAYLIAIGVGVLLAVITGTVFYKINTKTNVYQRQLNKLENRLDAAGARWLADLFAAAVIGDLATVEVHLKQFIEADNMTGFFMDNISMPLTMYTIQQSTLHYPDKLTVIKNTVDAALASMNKKNGAVAEQTS